jgi:hypothetical protein
VAEARRTFGPVVLVGVLAGAALAMAGTQPWFAFQTDDKSFSCSAPCVGFSYEDAGTVSAANAVALVALACWGVLLVSRGRFRRAVSFVGLLAAVGAVVALVLAYPNVPDDLRELAAQSGSDIPDVGSTGWFWVGAVASGLGLLAWLAAVRFVKDWPEMGRKYDGPSGAGSDTPPDDLWKAMDQGHDPTS